MNVQIHTDSLQVIPIGVVESQYRNLKDCPFQGSDNCPPAIINIFPEYAQGLMHLKQGQEIVIITFLDKARRDSLQCRPRNDPDRPLHGVFATRSPNRPNPLGLHHVRIISLQKTSFSVHPLEVLDGTPVVDIKPMLRKEEKKHPIKQYFDLQEINKVISASVHACSKGLLNGLNGNLSIKKDNLMLITRSGCAKGFLTLDDLCAVDIDTGKLIAGNGRPSSEAGMHLNIYKKQPEAGAVAHTHPINLLSVSSTQEDGKSLFEHINLFEGKAIAELACQVPAHQPGSKELADATGSASKDFKCIIMHSHGLTCWEKDLSSAVALCDELEALAEIELKNRLLNIL